MQAILETCDVRRKFLAAPIGMWNLQCESGAALNGASAKAALVFRLGFGWGGFLSHAGNPSNETKMSDGGRGRASIGVEVRKSSQKVERTAVRRSLHRTVRRRMTRAITWKVS